MFASADCSLTLMFCVSPSKRPPSLRQLDLDDEDYGRAYRRQLAALPRRELRITLCVYGMARVFLRSAQCAIAHEPDHLRPYNFVNHILNGPPARRPNLGTGSSNRKDRN